MQIREYFVEPPNLVLTAKFGNSDCIKAKLTADMTAISFETHSHNGTLWHTIAQEA
jgi:hypothetical protein